MNIIKIGLSGANGRMGQEIESIINSKATKFEITAKLTRKSQINDIENACNMCDVIIDFSTPDSLKDLLHYASNKSTPVIIGTTGLSQKHFEYITKASNSTAIIYAPNTSLGANLIEDLSIRAADILRNYDIEILEAHHKHKKDSPSGTAISVGKAIAAARQIDFDTNAVFDRSSKGMRNKNDISFASLRGGGIFGDHKVIFAGDHELVTIGHSALSRSAFAEGALHAASWIFDKSPGLYSMRDVLNLDKNIK